MRLALRSIFWLVLVAAVLVGWTVEHCRAISRIEQTPQDPFWLSRDEPNKLSEGAKRRNAELKGLALVSDEELAQRLHDLQAVAARDGGGSQDLVLYEMAKRKMADELQAAYSRMTVMTKESGRERLHFPDNLKLLTGLRRAQGQPDPIRLHVEFRLDDKEPDAPLLLATLENVDVEREPVGISEGFDYRSGRRTRWRVHLSDESGRQEPDANFTFWGLGGGIGTGTVLAFGEKGSWQNGLDARSYVRPGKTGRYQLRLVHTPDTIDLASETDLNGLIVFQSDPIEVDVTVPAPQTSPISTTLLLGALAFAILLASTSIVRRHLADASPTKARSPLITWRDLLVLIVVAGLVVAWRVDLTILSHKQRLLERDEDSGWTMRPTANAS